MFYLSVPFFVENERPIMLKELFFFLSIREREKERKREEVVTIFVLIDYSNC